MNAGADLHLHSRFSARADEGFLQVVRAPGSSSEPLEVYRRCRERFTALFATPEEAETVPAEAPPRRAATAV